MLYLIICNKYRYILWCLIVWFILSNKNYIKIIPFNKIEKFFFRLYIISSTYLFRYFYRPYHYIINTYLHIFFHKQLTFIFNLGHHFCSANIIQTKKLRKKMIYYVLLNKLNWIILYTFGFYHWHYIF